MLKRRKNECECGSCDDCRRRNRGGQCLCKDGNLADNDLKRTKRALDFASEEHEYDYEDWSGIVAIGAKFAETNGYVSVPYASLWQWAGLREMEYAPIAKSYENAGVFGEWVRIGDLQIGRAHV